MVKNKKPTITNKMQEVAVDILERIIAAEWEGKPVGKEFYDSVMSDYELREDPFTHFPCTCKEYAKNREEYDRQLMVERYGYYE